MDETAGSDEDLLVELRRLLARSGPPPEVVEAAKEGYAWRTVDAELARLTGDSLLDQPLAGVRGGAEPRTLSFEAVGLTIDVEVAGSGRNRRMLGQLVPPQPARIEVRQGDAVRVVTADAMGRFMVEELDSRRPLSLRCHLLDRQPVVTEWVVV